MAQRFTKKDVSSVLRQSEAGMIDQVMVTTNVDGQRFVKVKVNPLAQHCSGAHLHNLQCCEKACSSPKQCQRLMQ